MELKSIALFFNSKRETCSKAAKDLKASLEKEHIKTKILPYDNLKINQNFDLIFSLGGDGSLLKIVRKSAHRKIKILGLNFGHLGFLTYGKQTGLKELLKALKADKFCLHERALIDVQVIRNKKVVFKGIALNECTIKSNKARAIHLNTFYEKSELKEYFADGLMLCTPTGSTAYNLAAGGPIIHPSTPAVVLTPVAPGSLSVRPMVLSLSSKKLQMKSAADKTLDLVFDGRTTVALKPTDVVTLVESKLVTTFIRLKHTGFVGALREKLGWTGKPRQV